MATYPTNPALPIGDTNTEVSPVNWNMLINNINAIGADLVDARSDGQTFPGTPYTALQSTDINDILNAIKCLIKDLSGETNWYNEPNSDIAALAAALGGLAYTQFLRSDASDSFSSGTLTIDNGAVLAVKGTLNIYDTDASHAMSIVWNENDTATRILNLSVAGGDRALILNEDFTVGDGYGGTIVFTGAIKSLIISDNAIVNQDLSTTAIPYHAGMELINADIAQLTLSHTSESIDAIFRVDALGYLTITPSGGIIQIPEAGYLNFGIDAGDGGYGIRRNSVSGAMEYRSTGGTWDVIGSAAGGADIIIENDTSVETIDTGTGNIVSTVDNAEISRMTVTGLGIFETAPAWPLDIGILSATGVAAIRLQEYDKSLLTGGLAPSAGVIVHDDDGKLYFYNGVTWDDLTAGAAGAVVNVLDTEDAWAAAVTYNMPASASNHFYVIQKADNSHNAVIVDPNSTEMISGADTYRLTRQYQTLGVIGDGVNWQKLFDTGEKLNVKDFGAQGDASTDDTIAVRKAIRACGLHTDKIIYFPKGYYKFTEPIYFHSNQSIEGEGTGSQLWQASDKTLIEYRDPAVRGYVNGKYYHAGDALNGGIDDISLSLRIIWGATTTAQETLIAKSIAIGSQGYMVYIEDGYVKAMISDGTDTYILAGTTKLNAGATYHIGVVFDRDNAANCKIYLDADDDTASRTGTLANVNTVTNASNFTIAAESDGGNTAAIYVYDVRVYIGGVWSAANIQEQYENVNNIALGGTYNSYWYFNDGETATYITDQIGVNNLSFDGGGTTYGGTGGHSRSLQTDYYHLHIKDLYLDSSAVSDGTCLLYLSNFSNNIVSNILCRGAYYGVYLNSSLRNSFYDIKTNSAGGRAAIQWLIYITHTTAKSNSNSFYNIQPRGGAAACINGIYFDGGGEGDIYIYNSPLEGMSGYALYLANGHDGTIIQGCHCEFTGLGTYLYGYKCASLRGNYFGSGLTLLNCALIEISHCRVSGFVHIGPTNNHISFHDNFKGVAAVYTIDETVCEVYNIIDDSASYQQALKTQAAAKYSPTNLAINGSFETWDAGMPTGGWTTTYGSPTITEESSIKCFGSKSAKVTFTTANGLLSFPIDNATLIQTFFPDAINFVGQKWQWTNSVTVPGEYWLELDGGGNPGIERPKGIILNNYPRYKGAAYSDPPQAPGGLAASTWGWGEGDSQGFNTVYLRITAGDPGTDPESGGIGYVKGIYKTRYLTVAAWFYKPNTVTGNGVNPSIIFRPTFYGTTQNFSVVFSIEPEQWTRCIARFEILATYSNALVGVGSADTSAGKIFYVDGIEIREGEQASPTFSE